MIRTNTLITAAIAGTLLAAALPASAEPEGSYERFVERVEKIKEQYPAAKDVPIPDRQGNVVEVTENGKKAKARVKMPAPEGMPSEEAAQVEKIVDLGISKLRAVAAKDGTILYIADLGRYVIQGRLLDVWHRKELKTIDEIEASVNRIDLEGIGYDKDKYARYSIGTGEKRVVVFVDPRCSWCHKLIAEVLESDALKSEYRFFFHFIPVLGGESQPLVRKLFCSKATDEEKVRAAVEGPDAIKALPALAECNTTNNDHTIYLSKILGVRGVPFVIAPDGRRSEGKPASLTEFLSNGRIKDPAKKEK